MGLPGRRLVISDILLGSLEVVPVECRPEAAGFNYHDLDTQASDLLLQGPGDLLEGCLGRGVVAGTDTRLDRRNRGNVDDRPAVLVPHVGQKMPDQFDRPEQVRGVNFTDPFVLAFFNRSPVTMPGVGHQYIDQSKIIKLFNGQHN